MAMFEKRSMSARLVGVMANVLLSSLSAAPALAANPPSFLPPVNYSGNIGTWYLATGDFNGDGHVDFAFSSHVSHTVTVYFGDGAGGFTRGPDLTTAPVGNGPLVVVVADFNNDGKADIAVSNNNVTNPGVVSVFLGNGAGGFGPRRDFPVGVGPQPLAVADLNADGNLDLMAGSAGGFSVLLGDGTGGFATTFITGATAGAIADFNGDGHRDLVALDFGTQQGSILLGDGAGNFSPAAGSPFPVTGATGGASWIAVGDFNRDGKADFAFAQFTLGTAAVFLGDGGGGVGAPTIYSTGTQPLYIAVGDLNGDGHFDLAVANEGSNAVSILLGDGTGGFSTPTLFATGAQPRSVALADFNGDSKLDMAVANNGSNDVSVFINNTVLAYSATVRPPINSDGSSVFSSERGVVPVKFTLTQDGSPTCSLPPATISLFRTSGSAPGQVNEASYLSPADSGSNFRISDCQYLYNLSVKLLGSGTYVVKISIGGTEVGSATFELS